VRLDLGWVPVRPQRHVEEDATMRIHSNCLGRALLATFAASTVMIGSSQVRAAVSDQLVVNIGTYQQNETETEAARDGSEEDGILLVGVP
jgi:hypothetical protein